MQTILDFLNKLKTLPTIGKIFSLIGIMIALIVMLFFSGCGTMTSATIRNIQPNTNTSIQITNQTEMNTDVNTTATPNVSFNPKQDEK